jgi:anti-sigma B factor antagonist
MEETEAIFEIGRRAGYGLLSIVGEVDIANVHELEAALANADTGNGDLIVDMTGVRYMDSSGFAALLDGARRLRGRGATVHLAGCSPTIKRLLDVTRLNIIFRLHPDLRGAEENVNRAPADAGAA